MKIRNVVPLLLLVTCSAALAAGKDGGTSAQDQLDPNATRCRSVREVGSRIPQRVCKTNAEWKKEAEAARAAMENRNRSSSCGGTAC